MAGTRKIAAILVADVVGYSRLAGADEDRTLARLRALRSDLIDPIISVHHGRIVKRTGDGTLIEFRSVVDAVRCAIEVQNGLIERNAGLPPERRIEFRIGIHLGDVIEESDGDLMGDGVNIAARLEGICQAGRDLSLRAGLLAGESAARSRGHRSRPDPTQEHRRPGARLFARSRQAGAGEAGPKRRNRWRRSPRVRRAHRDRGGAWYFLGNRRRPSCRSAAAPARAAHLSIVVLPFTNLSDDPRQDYFADGITENLTTDLSRIRNSFVIARNTAFTYKGKNVDAKEIGKELGVRYVLEGSVQREQNRVRVNAQLIDAESGAHLWADRFEDDVADLFKLQDQVVARLANTWAIELVKAEAEKGARSKNPDAIDLVMRGWACVAGCSSRRRRITTMRRKPCSNRRSRSTRTTPTRLAGDALPYLPNTLLGWPTRGTDYEAKILGQADRAIALAPDNVWAYYVKSLYLLSQRANEALSAADAGLAMNPNFAALYAGASARENFSRTFRASDIRHATSDAVKSARSENWLVAFSLGNAELGLGHFDAAIDEYHQAIDAGFRALTNLTRIWPPPMRSKARWKRRSPPWRKPAASIPPHHQMVAIRTRRAHRPCFEGLRKAGLPEESARPGKSRQFWSRMLSATAGSRERTRIAPWRGCGRCAATSLIRPSPCIMVASSSAPATAASSNSAAWSTRCAARSKCRTASSSATRACRRSAASSSDRHSSWRRRRGKRRRPDGRRRQYRRAPRGDRQAGRDLSFRGRLPSGRAAGSTWR